MSRNLGGVKIKIRFTSTEDSNVGAVKLVFEVQYCLLQHLLFTN